MCQGELILWSACIIGGFLLGSVMFSQLIPKILLNKDIATISDDHNPGATNVFVCCGPYWGLACLSLDILKGFLPVYISLHLLDTDDYLFAAVLAAPVMGHAIAPLNRFRGGKCIATSFGVLLGLLPLTNIVLLLAGIYIVFSTVLKINPNRIRSITTFGLFGMISLIVLIHRCQYSIAIGCMLISLTAIAKHSKRFMVEAYSPVS